jgi:mRNA interferase RelE/StbE
MDHYLVEVRPAARKALESITTRDRDRISRAVESLAENPHPHGSKKLRGGEGFWRIRVGDYRVIYTVIQDRLVVVVVTIGHRREVYR